MSKKTCRGYAYTAHHMVCDPQNKVKNATIVHDAVCFPVKEAMALIKVIAEERDDMRYWRSNFDPRKTLDAHDKYLAAVERLKKKASKS